MAGGQAISGAAILGALSKELISQYGAHRHDDEVTKARDSYSDSRGRVFEDDEEWESFTSAFLEWYVVERSWKDEGLCPALLAASSEHDESKRAALLALASGQRSLVEIRKLGKNRIDLVDLIGNGAFSVREERSLVGMNVGDIVELRLYGFQGVVSLGRTFVYHPAGVASAIVSLIQKYQGQGLSRAESVDRLAALRLRSQRYRHVPAVRMYEKDGELER